jgi:hypothetical protein
MFGVISDNHRVDIFREIALTFCVSFHWEDRSLFYTPPKSVDIPGKLVDIPGRWHHYS